MSETWRRDYLVQHAIVRSILGEDGGIAPLGHRINSTAGRPVEPWHCQCTVPKTSLRYLGTYDLLCEFPNGALKGPPLKGDASNSCSKEKRKSIVSIRDKHFAIFLGDQMNVVVV